VSVQDDQAAAESWDAAGTGNKVGAALEVVPVLGPFLHAASVALAAIIGAISGSLRDTFHPDAGTAEAWLVIARIFPAIMLLNIDRAQDPVAAANLARYFRLVSGEIKPGQHGANGALNNPHISTACDNPYQCAVDPLEPLTDPAVMARVQTAYHAWLAQMGGSVPDPQHMTPAQRVTLRKLPLAVPAFHRTQQDATALLGLIRKNLPAFTSLSGWSEFSGNLPQLREEVRAMRALAGETHKDPALDHLFGGDVTPRPDELPRKAPPLRPAAPSPNVAAAPAAAPVSDAPGPTSAAWWTRRRVGLAVAGVCVFGIAAIVAASSSSPRGGQK
jgi:hypothetical protein